MYEFSECMLGNLFWRPYSTDQMLRFH